MLPLAQHARVRIAQAVSVFALDGRLSRHAPVRQRGRVELGEGLRPAVPTSSDGGLDEQIQFCGDLRGGRSRLAVGAFAVLGSVVGTTIGVLAGVGALACCSFFQHGYLPFEAFQRALSTRVVCVSVPRFRSQAAESSTLEPQRAPRAGPRLRAGRVANSTERRSPASSCLAPGPRGRGTP